MHRGRQRFEPGAIGDGYDCLGIQRQAGVQELIPRAHVLELLGEAGRGLRRRGLRQPAPRAPPIEPEAVDGLAQPDLVGVRRRAPEQRFHQGGPDGGREVLWKRARHRLHLALQHEPEVGHGADHEQPAAAAPRLEHDLGGPAVRVPPDRPLGELGPLDARPRHAEAVGEVAQRARHRPPAAAHRVAADPCLTTVRRLLVDHQVERHHLGDQVGERREGAVVGVREPLGERQLELPIHRGHAQRDVFDRLHEHPASLGPAVYGIAEQMPGQTVHRAHVAVLVDGLSVDIVGGEVIAPRDHEPLQVALFARHAVQRLDVGRHRDQRGERRVGVVKELPPGPFHRHRLDLTAVAGELPPLDQPALGEERDGVAVRPAIEGHGQVEVLGVHTERGAGDRHALGVAGELELRGRGPELVEREIAIAQDVHLPTGDAAVHAARHLQDLVGSEVQPGEDVPPPLHHVGVAGIIDHYGVEPRDVQRRLPGGGHGEEEGPGHRAVEEGPDHADRLAAMVEGGRQHLPAVAQLARDLLHLGAGGDEHGDAAPLPHHAPHEALVEELQGSLRQDAHLGSPRRVERAGLEHLGRIEVARVEARVHRGRQPDEAAPHPLAQREAELELGRGLVDLVHDEGVARGDQPVLEPAPGDAGRDDHDVPGRRLRGRLALAVHDPDLERRPEDRLGHGPDGEGLPRPGAGHDAEAATRGGEPLDVLPVLALEQRLDGERQGELDRLAGGAGRGDDDHPPGGRLGG